VFGMTRCTAGVLRGAVILPDEGAGQRFGLLVVTNVGGDCTLFGFSGLQLIGHDGEELPTQAVWDLEPGPSTVTLPVRGVAAANMRWSVVPGEGDAQNGPCQPNPVALRLVPPDETEQFEIPWPYGSACERGQIHLSAYYAPPV
jgi:Domain of unknown function (DUF4232)